MPTLEFLNVDLEMVSEQEPKVLLHDLKRKVVVLYSGESPNGHLTCLELAPSLASKRRDAIRTLQRWVEVLQKLSPNAGREWRAANSRKLDVGFEVARDKQRSQVELPAELLESLASLGASYVITLYRAELSPLQKPTTKAKR